MNKGKYLYTYKRRNKIMPLAMVDDLLNIAKCGTDSNDVHIFINTEIEMTKLRFYIPDSEGMSKCNKMHIGK